MGCRQSSPVAAVREAPTTLVLPSDHQAVPLLMEIEDNLATALASGAIKLIRADYLRRSSLAHLACRQALEALEKEKRVEVFLSPEEAVDAFRSNSRCIAAFTYGWVTRDHPDVTGDYLDAMRGYLAHSLGAHVVGLFWDFASLPQPPRTEAEEMLLATGMSAMAYLYASPFGTTVLRHRTIPKRPPELDGEMIVFVEGNEVTPEEFIALSAELAKHGMIENLRRGPGRLRVRFESHAAAQAAVAAGVPGATAVLLLFNSMPYEDRGWPCFESGVAPEAIMRARCYDGLNSVLALLPPKIIDIDGLDGPRVADEDEASFTGDDEGVGARIERVRASLKAATFMGRGDDEGVGFLYSEYIARMTIVNNVIIDTMNVIEGVYDGECNDAGEEEGYGTCRYASGNVYEGEWKGGKQEGRGTFKFADGAVYEGKYKAGKMDGRGTYRMVDGSVYEGEFKADMMHGKGSFKWADGVVYEGEYREGKHDGLGTLRWDGNATVSYYTEDQLVGEGVQWSADGQTASRLLDGTPGKSISFEEARQVAAEYGLPLPAEGVASGKASLVSPRNLFGTPRANGSAAPKHEFAQSRISPHIPKHEEAVAIKRTTKDT